MELEALRLVILEEDLNRLARERTPPEAPVKEVQARVTSEGLSIAGKAATVTFESHWTIGVVDRKLEIRLRDIHAGWLPAGMLRGMLVNSLRDAAARTPGVQVEEEFIRVDPDVVLAHYGVPLKTNLTAVRCEAGRVVIEAAK
jgi:hypothetical protein